ncbi:MAG: hypothetical protein JW765_05310 [Deltaproteobacteria bacterium]|nr:hypothetical protein [Candidatus Zymogenaceae bacterium]
MLLSKKYQDNFALGIIALIIKRNEINKANTREARKKLIEEFEINAAILDRGLEYLKEIRERRKS